MEKMKTLLSENNEVVEMFSNVFEFGAEITAIIAEDAVPFFSLVAPIFQLAQENKDIAFMREQFEKVKNQIQKVSEGIQRIHEEFKKTSVDVKLFSVEENIIHQYRNYMDFLKKKSDYYKGEFLNHFDASGGKKPLKDLYNGTVTKEGLFGHDPLLDVIQTYEENSRRAIEEYFARLKSLFFMGIIALLGHDVLTKSGKQEKHLKKWSEKMKDIQDKMDNVIQDCIDKFPRQAKADCQKLVREQTNLTNQQLADVLIDMLKKKYDWVGWFVRVYKSKSRIFVFKKKCERPTGLSRFQVTTTDRNLKMWVSYCTSPKPLDKNLIQEFIQSQEEPTVENITEHLFEKLPGHYMVHAVKSCKDLACSWSFREDCFYQEKHKKLHVWVHPF